MNLYSSRVRLNDYELNNDQNSNVSNPIKETAVIEAEFYKEKPLTVREMITRKINKTLCFCLGVSIMVTFISYYISMNYEAKLNALDNEIVRINSENQDLQSELDRLKSFNNVDNKIGEFNLLQKAEKVIEVTALNVIKKEIIPAEKTAGNIFNQTIGY